MLRDMPSQPTAPTISNNTLMTIVKNHNRAPMVVFLNMDEAPGKRGNWNEGGAPRRCPVHLRRRRRILYRYWWPSHA
ncbi:hypothetical protein CBM2587_A160215 [Cupriavidus taiwanensis]|uniref:Uncharacterized protein n=1 Tax=Cupriavidus taiwanensis TaxID=164546 RepID=A0A975WVP2_9BURK|nr:hypothetical protein CBM2587_A160215 [Cupriavidus taiwanensis]